MLRSYSVTLCAMASPLEKHESGLILVPGLTRKGKFILILTKLGKMATRIIFKIIICALCFFTLIACKREEKKPTNRTVYIRQIKGRYELMKSGEPFSVKGASGYTNFSALKLAGGNTVRTWDTTGLGAILDSAHANNLKVIAGFYFCGHDNLAFFDNQIEVDRQYRLYEKVVRRFQNHPALLMWSVGNELFFPFKFSYNKFYRAFNNLTDMIHQQDPNHPVTTVIGSFNDEYIANLVLRCDIDIISFNLYSRINDFKSQLKDFAWFWNGPYMLAEWGIDGPWQGSAQTAWGAYIEPTSNSKVKIATARYLHDMPTQDPRFLGACIFYWGQKQEGTHTWFSLFDECGAKSELVAAIEGIWTKKTIINLPSLKYMLLNSKGAADNIILTPYKASMAELVFDSYSKDDITSINWQILKEDWFREAGRASKTKPEIIQNLGLKSADTKVEFQAPSQEGPYRIFAVIYNKKGYFSTCNIPFYVVSLR